ncbi:MAG: hypothetical protein ACFCVA_16115, partial [Gammaproteobacteria bacterium]
MRQRVRCPKGEGYLATQTLMDAIASVFYRCGCPDCHHFDIGLESWLTHGHGTGQETEGDAMASLGALIV